VLVLVILAGCHHRTGHPSTSNDGVCPAASVPVAWTLYTDEEAKALVVSAEQVVPAGRARRKDDVLRELHIDHGRLQELRVERIMLAERVTWRLSEGFDITWLVAEDDPASLDRDGQEIYGVRVLARKPVSEDLEAAGLLSNRPLERAGLAPRR
jgi:hypothetical protein